MPYFLFWLGCLCGVVSASFTTFVSVLVECIVLVLISLAKKLRWRFYGWILFIQLAFALGFLVGVVKQSETIVAGDICSGYTEKISAKTITVRIESCLSSRADRTLVIVPNHGNKEILRYQLNVVRIQKASRFGRYVGVAEFVKTGKVPHSGLVSRVTYTLLSLGNAFKYNYFGALSEYMPVENSSLVCSILFGETELQEDVLTTMRETGVLHAIAISGVNISYLLMLLTFVFKAFSRGVRERIDILALCGLYCVVGPAVSLQRAIVMVLVQQFVSFCGGLWSREMFWFCLSLLILLDPGVVQDVGYWFVSAACVGIYVVVPLIKRLNLQNGVLEEIAKTSAVWACVAPVQWVIFSTITPIGILAGFVIAPLIEVVTVFGYASILLRFIPVAGVLVMKVLGVLSSLILWSTRVFHGL